MFIPLIIDGIRTHYLVSPKGEIKNSKTDKILKGTIRSNYLMVKLTINHTKKDYLVHRLVAMMFLPNPLNLPQVHHKDHNVLNNAVTNLQWVTIEDNMQLRRVRKNVSLPKQEIQLDEHWKQYQDSNYWISDNGKCYNKKTQHMLTPIKNGKYYKYCFSINGEKTSCLIHKIVYYLFNGPYDEHYQINHIDGDKANNALSNLELVTRNENMTHSYYTLQQNVVLVNQYDLAGNLINSFKSISDAARQTGCTISAISQVCAGKAKTHKGFIWKKVV